MVYNSFRPFNPLQRCTLCHTPVHPAASVCKECENDLPWLPESCPRCALPSPGSLTCAQCKTTTSPLNRTHAAFAYGFPVDRLINHLKHHGKTSLAQDLASLLCNRLPAMQSGTLVPVPLHPQRLRERGFNQAEVLARQLATLTRRPVTSHLLTRTRATTRQQTLDADTRKGNLQGAFSINKAIVPPAHVILIDDVITTGSTIQEIAVTLKAAGVRRIDAWCIARTL